MTTDQKVMPLQQLLDSDLEVVCLDLEKEFSQMSGKRLLITGGAGFLGYYLIFAALHWNRTRKQHKPIDVTVYDSYIRGVPAWLETVSREPNLHLHKQDMTQPLPKDMGHFAFIIHAAGIASPIFYRKRPLECIDANIIGLRNLLDYAVARDKAGQPLEGFLFYSSSEIYGDPSADQIPTPETYRGLVSCTGPRACYDESKRFGETLCVVYAQQFNVPVKIARPFNNYGPGLKITDGRVMPDLARNALANEDLVLLSDGSPTRTFCYATDAITGYYKVLVRGHKGEPYNVGIEKPEISMRKLAEIVADQAKSLFGYTGKVVLGKAQQADYLIDNPNRRCPIIAKSRDHLDFQPRVLPEDGVRRSLIWYWHNRVAETA